MPFCLKCCFKCNMNIPHEEVLFCICPARDKRILCQEITQLGGMKQDVEREIRYRDPSMQARSEVNAWLRSVEELVNQVDPILTNFANNDDSPSYHPCLCCGSCSNHAVGLTIKQSIEMAKDLRSQKCNWASILVPKRSIELLPSLPNNIVGIKEMTSRIVDYLNDDEGGVVGIYGMGGAGKTTLAKNIIDVLQSAETKSFDEIIWVDVSQSFNFTSTQEHIAIKLGCSESNMPKNENTRASFISEKLSQTRFLLVLDDVWKQIDLSKIGIPSFNDRDKRKVLLTTRDETVCIDMGARRRLKVQMLKDNYPWDLFQKTIGNDDILLSEGIHQLAKEIVNRCGGLPLLLVTIARAMATKTTNEEWRHAVDQLKNHPHEIRRMEEVYELLKFSFDNLGSDEHRSLLRYITLYRKGDRFNIKAIIDYWTCGEVFESSYQCDIDMLRDRGKSIVSDLQDACLLERSIDDGLVSAHDAIYDMILWLGKCGYASKIITHANDNRKEVTVDETWKDVDMVSLSWNDIEKVVVPDNSNKFKSIRVLLIHRSELDSKHVNILLQFLPNLRVLDLSFNRSLTNFPKSLCSLTSLRYLNISSTGMKALPIQMKNLTNLMHLDLSLINNESCNLKDILASLSKLQILDLTFYRESVIPKHRSPFHYCRKFQRRNFHIIELETFTQLKDVRLPELQNVDDLRSLLGSHVLYRCIIQLSISDMDLTTDDVHKISWRMEKLKELTIYHCLNNHHEFMIEGHLASLNCLGIYEEVCLQRIVLNNQIPTHPLTHLNLISCPELQDISCLWQLPKLLYLHLFNCGKIREILLPQSEDQSINSAPLSRLKDLCLNKMQALVRISSSLLPLPSLKWLDIEDCPLLRKLSIEKSSFENVTILCKKEWWDSLEWDNGAPQPKKISFRS